MTDKCGEAFDAWWGAYLELSASPMGKEGARLAWYAAWSACGQSDEALNSLLKSRDELVAIKAEVIKAQGAHMASWLNPDVKRAHAQIDVYLQSARGKIAALKSMEAAHPTKE